MAVNTLAASLALLPGDRKAIVSMAAKLMLEQMMERGYSKDEILLHINSFLDSYFALIEASFPHGTGRC